MSVYLAAGGAAWGVIWLAGLAGAIYADVASIVILYTTIAPRDLVRHSMAVAHALAAGDLAEARRRVATIVGRDTEELDEPGVVRAGVESVAESTVDGVTAPLFWALVAGPVGAMVYRAINTLDSMFGHQDDRYLQFGWAAARIDDLANYLPARLTAPLLCLAALLLGQRPLQAVRAPSAATGENTPAPTPAWPRPPWPAPWACNLAAGIPTPENRSNSRRSAIPCCRWSPVTSRWPTP